MGCNNKPYGFTGGSFSLNLYIFLFIYIYRIKRKKDISRVICFHMSSRLLILKFQYFQDTNKDFFFLIDIVYFHFEQ